MSEYDIRYERYRTEFEEYAAEYMRTLKTQPSVLGESMAYSLQNGGKRIRPVLALACADVLGLDRREILPFALALEMIHTYSLIHDDLPGMDNDTLRRGRPTNHVVFGEGQDTGFHLLGAVLFFAAFLVLRIKKTNPIAVMLGCGAAYTCWKLITGEVLLF